MKVHAAASLCALTLGLAACGSSDEGQPAAQTTPVKPVAKLTITSPIDGATVRTASVAVRGTVTPTGARVLVTGKPAQVTDGVFAATVALSSGENTIDVVATAPGVDPVTKTVTVTRGRTEAQLNAALARKRRARAAAARRQKARREAAATERSQAGGSSGSRPPGCITVPNVVGKDHQLAQDTMQATGFYALDEEDATGQDRVLLLDRNWRTVAQKPAAGSCMSEDTTILLSAKKDDE